MNTGSYTWKITDQLVIKRIYNADFKQAFGGDMFEIGKLKWQHILYPNGFSEKSKGSFMICIKLIKMPKTWKKIITNRTSKCVQTTTSNTNIESFTTSGQIKPGSRYTLTLAELKTLNPSEITIITSINILNIIQKNNQSLYRMRIRHFEPKPKFTWKINKSMINYKQGWFTKALESQVHDEMFLMRCYPNGKETKGYLSIELMLLALPRNISKLKLSYRIKCVELDISKFGTNELYFSDNDVGINSTGFTEFIQHKQVKDLDTLTFETEIDILNGYDDHHNYLSVTEIEWTAYANQVNYNQQQVFEEQKYDNISTDEISGIKQHLNEISKQLKLINETKENDDIDNIKKEIEIMKRNINILMNDKSLYDSKQHKKQAAMRQFMSNVVGLPEYIDLFIENGIEDMDTIKHITMNELQVIGIDKIGHKIKITKAIQQLNQQNQEPKSD